MFPEVARRSREYVAVHSDAKTISLSIGNTTEPLMPHITKAMADYVFSLGTLEGYTGYGDERGMPELCEKIADVFYPGIVSADEVFISDGAKCDIARIQTLFRSTSIGRTFLSGRSTSQHIHLSNEDRGFSYCDLIVIAKDEERFIKQMRKVSTLLRMML